MMILGPGGSSLTSDIDTLGLSIGTDALLKQYAIRQTISGTSATTVYTFTPPSTFTGDCIFSFELRFSCYGQASTSDNKCGGLWKFICASRISGALSVASGAGVASGTFRNESGSQACGLAVSGSDILVQITQGVAAQHTWAGTILIMGLKV